MTASANLGFVTAGQASPADWDCRVHEAMIPAATLGPETPCRVVFDLLTANPTCPAVAIVDDAAAVVGAVTRNACIDTLSKPLLLDLYARRPVRQLMKSPLTIEAETTLDAATEIISRCDPQALVDGFVVVDGGRYAGLVSPQGLLSLNVDQSRRRANHMQAAQDNIVRQKQETDAAREQLRNLLDSSGQGFLSFGVDLVVDPLHSAACNIMLGRAPAGLDLAALLFASDPVTQDLLRSITGKVFAEGHPVMREILLSLLPEEAALGERVLRMEFRPLDGRQMMLVLTDHTERRRLERAVEAERKHLEMIVAAVSHRRDVFDTVEDFRQFLSGRLDELLAAPVVPTAILDEVYREIHTFKGLFNQFSFAKLPFALHEVEGGLAALKPMEDQLTVERIASVVRSGVLAARLDEDLAVILDRLGESFLEGRVSVPLSAELALRLERLATALANAEPVDLAAADVRDLLEELSAIRKVSFKGVLTSFDGVVAQMALRLGKEVAPIRVEGADVLVDPDAIRPLQRSLVHVFRNAVAHGIEDPDERLDAGKDEAGTITCRLAMDDKMITIDIGDDGRGVDVDALRQKAVGLGLYGQDQAAGLTDRQVADLVFTDHLSTASALSDFAGRGVGLGAVRSTVRQLDGDVGAATEPGKGMRLIFSIPGRALRSKG